MPITLPAHSPRTRSLTDVVPEMFRSLRGESIWLRPAQSTVLVMLDGVGAAQLRARAGHARFLASISGIRDVARTTFPSTTASALTGLLTATDPGHNGMLGYRVRVPKTGRVANLLHGWEDGDLPDDWQQEQPLTRAQARHAPVFVVSKPEFATTGFTRATTDGAKFVGVTDLDERIARAGALAAQHPGSFTYLYVPELDGIGHRAGWESGAWTEGLERVDASLRDLVRAAPQAGVLITADHGMIDVPASRHVLLDDGDPRLEGVADIAGEPRMLHLYTEPQAADAVAGVWRAADADRAWVMTRDEAIAAGVFGSVRPTVADRIGDVLVAARARVAYYDNRLDDRSPQRMVGQHGSLTLEESVVPLLRAGAYAV